MTKNKELYYIMTKNQRPEFNQTSKPYFPGKGNQAVSLRRAQFFTGVSPPPSKNKIKKYCRHYAPKGGSKKYWPQKFNVRKGIFKILDHNFVKND